MNRPDLTITISRRALRFTGVICLSILLLLSSLTYAYGQASQIKVQATVAGWFKAERIDNENVGLATNMDVWVNGRQFMICTDPIQPVNISKTPSY